MENKLKTACLVSGGGTNLQAIIDNIEAGKLEAEIAAVISNVPGVGALERAKRHGLPWFVVNNKDFATRELFDRELASIIDRQEAKLVCLCGFMRVLTPEFVDHYKNRIINIHPALLPDFGGKGFYGHKVHEAVLASGIKESGCTVHFVDKEVDHGPIILQRTVEVLPGDTPDTLAERVLQEEHKAYSQAIELFAQNRLEIKDRKVLVKPS
ncbi:phosphoribosylglycinamide formyltransferase [candidate division TA06 bacterium]|uniref:Phosphoribosylglycinamide formyltransferase n=1 Tax=candidate division TA06 bacterium TaxID=2250710 RepID=A0A933MHS4_UNCT6|nr:phosphoribosylglycinamide formyltransferase [candidate division TA06 bacterium]